MNIEIITKQLRELLQPTDENPTGAALISLVDEFAIEVVRIDSKYFASFNESDNLIDQLKEIADTVTLSISELEDGLVERYWPEDDREDPRVCGYPIGSH